jgi:hypothetical protein
MNCFAAPFPTFLTPDGSKAGPPLELLVRAPAVEAGAAAAEEDATGAAATEAAPTAAEVANGAAEIAVPADPNPQPVFPFCVLAPGPEQIPVGFAQHPLPQSASLRHCPPMNCLAAPLPTLPVPAGSKGGTASTMTATV